MEEVYILLSFLSAKLMGVISIPVFLEDLVLMNIRRCEVNKCQRPWLVGSPAFEVMMDSAMNEVECHFDCPFMWAMY